jgi:hypothetical protein
MLNNYTEVDIEKRATGRNFLKPFLFVISLKATEDTENTEKIKGKNKDTD